MRRGVWTSVPAASSFLKSPSVKVRNTELGLDDFTVSGTIIWHGLPFFFHRCHVWCVYWTWHELGLDDFTVLKTIIWHGLPFFHRWHVWCVYWTWTWLGWLHSAKDHQLTWATFFSTGGMCSVCTELDWIWPGWLHSSKDHHLTWTTFLFFSQVACVVCAPFVDGDSNTIYLLGNSTIVKREDMKKGFPLGEHFVELLFNLSIRFNAFQLHDTEKALFSALVLISPGRFRVFFCFFSTLLPAFCPQVCISLWLTLCCSVLFPTLGRLTLCCSVLFPMLGLISPVVCAYLSSILCSGPPLMRCVSAVPLLLFTTVVFISQMY